MITAIGQKLVQENLRRAIHDAPALHPHDGGAVNAQFGGQTRVVQA